MLLGDVRSDPTRDSYPDPDAAVSSHKSPRPSAGPPSSHTRHGTVGKIINDWRAGAVCTLRTLRPSSV